MSVFNGHPLADSPRGTWEPITDKRTVARYRAEPEKYQGSTKAVVLLYDMYGLTNDNAKYLADIYAEHLKVPVYVIDSRPSPVKPLSWNCLNPDRYFFRRCLDYLSLYKQMWTEFVPRAGLYSAEEILGRIKTGVQDLGDEGYTQLHILGFLQGADHAVMLLADPGSANPGLVKSAVLASPQTPGKEYYNKITHPACWIVSPDLLKKPATEGLLPYLESSSKPDNADFHSVPEFKRNLWGLPFFHVEEVDDPLKNNTDLLAINRVNELALEYLKRKIVAR